MTFADRLGFDKSEVGPQAGVDIVPGARPPEPSPIKPGDWVELRFARVYLNVDVTAIDENFVGIVRDVPPDLSVQLDGLSAGQEITFRLAHVFINH